MRITESREMLLLVVLLSAIAGGTLHAEVSADPASAHVSIIILGITEGPDPIPQALWQPIRDIPEARFLNPSGALRDDGRPDVAHDPADGLPHVVWAYDAGTDHDVAHSRWTGLDWSVTEFLTAGLTDELDPRLFVDADSTLHIVWWEGGAEAVRLTSRPSGEAGAAVETVADRGRRPSVVGHEGALLIAFERDASGGGQEVVVVKRVGPGLYLVEDLVAPTERTLPLDPMLHATPGRLWVDWKHSETAYAYSEQVDGAWMPPVFLPWTDDSWVRAEEARKAIRTIIETGP